MNNLAPAFDMNWQVEAILGHTVPAESPSDWIFVVKWAGSVDITPEPVSTLLVEPSYAADCVMDYLAETTHGGKLLCYELLDGEYMYSVRDAGLMNNGGYEGLVVAEKEYEMRKYEALLQHDFWGGFHKILVDWSPRPGNRHPTPTWEFLGVLALKPRVRRDIRRLIQEQYHGQRELALDVDHNGHPTGVGFVVRPRIGPQ